MLNRPDVLVLGGGGVLGDAWLTGVLAGIEDGAAIDMRDCEYFVGTSAGSIVTARLVAGQSPGRPAAAEPAVDGPAASEPDAPEPDDALAAAAAAATRFAGAVATAAGAPFAPLALGLVAPAGALVRAAMLQAIPEPRDTLDRLRDEILHSGARFDGRLRVAAVDRRTGRRVMFGSPGSPPASVAEAVTASCAVPWLFEPVVIRGREYVDGGVWSPTNLDAAPAGRDTQVLCLHPTANVAGSSNVLAVVRTLLRSAATVEALALRNRGASVQIVGPGEESAAVMGSDLMDPEPRRRVLAAGYRQGHTLAFATAP